MKVLSIAVASAVITGTLISTISTADAMGRKEDPEFNTFIMKMTDANNDGMISKDEFMKMSAKMAEKQFMMMDMNDDGQIDKVEFSMHNR